jgi:hypothetical protein
MGLQMKDKCQKCPELLPPDGLAFICSYECTFCGDCAEKMHWNCPNCGGELVERPKRLAASGARTA